MNDTQRGVAVLQALRHDAHRAHIKQLIKREVFFLHFAPDAVDMLRTAINLGFYAFFFNRFADQPHELVDVVFAIDPPLVQQFSDAFIFCRAQVAEAVILQLPFQLTNA